MIKQDRKKSVGFFINPCLKRSKKWVSAIVALVFLLTVCQPLEARPGNYGEYSSLEMFGVGMLVGAITDIVILLSCYTGGGGTAFTGAGASASGAAAGGAAAGAGAIGSQLAGLYIYYNEYETSGETIFETELLGTEVKISRGAYWSMVAGVVTGCAAGWVAGAVSGASSGAANAAATSTVDRVLNSAVEVAVKLSVGFVVMCIQKWWEEYLVQKHGVKRLWAQTATSIANLAVNLLGNLLLKQVRKGSEENGNVVGETGPNNQASFTGEDGKTINVTFKTASPNGQWETGTTETGATVRANRDNQGNLITFGTLGAGTTIATVTLDIVSVATGNGITALMQKAAGGVFKLFGINKVFTGYGQVKNKGEVDAGEKVVSDLKARLQETKATSNTQSSQQQDSEVTTKEALLAQAKEARARGDDKLAEDLETAASVAPLAGKISGAEVDPKALVEALKKDPSLLGQLQKLSTWYQVTGGIPQYQFMPLHDAILGEVISRGYAGALKQVAKVGILDLLSYRKYHGTDKKKNYENLVKMIIAESGANLVTGTVQGYTSDTLSINSFLKLTLKETGSGLAQIGLAHWTRDWNLHPALKGVVQLAGASIAGTTIDAAFRRGKGKDTELTAVGFVVEIGENFNKYFTKTAMDVALMPPLLTVSGVDPAVAQNEYEKYQDRLIGYYRSMADANYGGRTVDFTSVFMDDVNQKMLQSASADLGESLADSGARLLNKMGTDISTQDKSFKTWAQVSAEGTTQLEKDRQELDEKNRGIMPKPARRYGDPHLNLDISLSKTGEGDKKNEDGVDDGQENSEKADSEYRRYSLDRYSLDQNEAGIIRTELIRQGQGPILMQNRDDAGELVAGRYAASKSLDAQIGSLDKQISTRKAAEKSVTYLGWVPVIGAFAMAAAGGEEGYAERGYGVLSDVFKGGAEYAVSPTEEGLKEIKEMKEKIADLEKLDKKDGNLILSDEKAKLEAAIKNGKFASIYRSEVAGIAQPIEVRNSKSGLVERTTVDNYGRPIQTNYYDGQGRKEDKVTDYYGPHSGDFSVTTDYTQINSGDWSTRDEKREVSPETIEPSTIEEEYRRVEIEFDHDKFSIRENQKSKLEEISQIVKKNKGAKIMITGYASAPGSDAYNEKLSALRTVRVKQGLAAAGINSGQVRRFNFGERAADAQQPGSASHDKQQSDRVVVVTVITQKEIPGKKIPAVFQTVTVDKPQSFDANVTYKIGDAYTGTPGRSVEASYIGSGPQLITKGDKPNLSALYEGIEKVNGVPVPVSYSSVREEIMEKALQ